MGPCPGALTHAQWDPCALKAVGLLSCDAWRESRGMAWRPGGEVYLPCPPCPRPDGAAPLLRRGLLPLLCRPLHRAHHQRRRVAGAWLEPRARGARDARERRPLAPHWPKYRFRSGPPQILISKFRGAAANFEVDLDCQNVSVLAQDRAYRRRTPRCAGTSRLCPLARPFCRERAPAACKRWLAP